MLFLIPIALFGAIALVAIVGSADAGIAFVMSTIAAFAAVGCFLIAVFAGIAVLGSRNPSMAASNGETAGYFLLYAAIAAGCSALFYFVAKKTANKSRP